MTNRTVYQTLSNWMQAAIDCGDVAAAVEVRDKAERALMDDGTITIQQRADLEADFDAAGFDSLYEESTRYALAQPAPAIP